LIVYKPFWDTLEKSKESWYTLTKKHNISSGTLSRIKNGKDISTKTLNDLCRILDCRVEEILQYIPSDNDQKL
jgi:putative transcriptional regulator